MKISSLSLGLASGQTQEFGAVTSRTNLKHRLKEVLDCVVFEEPSVDGSGALTMPMLIVQTKVRQCEITFTYDLLSKEEGLLALYYTSAKGGRERQKEFGFVSFGELEDHLQRLLSESEAKFVENYFPKQTQASQAIKYLGFAYIIAACFGLLSLVFFSDFIWRDEFFQSAYIAAGITYVLTLPILLYRAFSQEGKQRSSQMGQTTTKQVIAILVGNIILSAAVIVGGGNLWHVISAKPVELDITFSDKNRDYWGKNCKGGVNIEHFFGAVCLEDRAYWKVIRPGMRAVAQGESSAVAFNVKAIELK
ncbi:MULTISPECIES: hypothetical protein [unclassified Shewanella]|uniref:hypothetical protein n=1 Tax=unclassified Shewanella TaxID=196818 RepID=UPI001BBC1F00|nr:MULTISPECIES: hypothetical protein [unclassified Shewanella]GIU15400.1 hypothetical protein TUM4444_26560 [Shewanella sp. MBTL60-112-B1]GIU34850.1 hypothetical protein TUM4445_23930 [Shewanella sp. MBTL60-112-B2]